MTDCSYGIFEQGRAAVPLSRHARHSRSVPRRGDSAGAHRHFSDGHFQGTLSSPLEKVVRSCGKNSEVNRRKAHAGVRPDAPYPCIVLSAAASAPSGSRGGLRCALVTDGGWEALCRAARCGALGRAGSAEMQRGLGAGAIQTGEEMQCPSGEGD